MSDLTAFARRAVATRVWKWVPGMRAVTLAGGFAGRMTEATLGIARPLFPDLTDAATLGCVEHGILAPLGVVVEREHYGGRLLHRWLQPETMRHGEWTGALPEALVLGLEAASAVEEGR